MNLVLLTGRLTKAPELRHTPQDVAVATFTIATNEGKDRDGNELTQFIRCEAWRLDAENISKFFKQGSPIIITGRIISDSWEKDGEKHYSTFVRVSRWEFAQREPKNSDDAPDGFTDLDEDEEDEKDLPF